MEVKEEETEGGGLRGEKKKGKDKRVGGGGRDSLVKSMSL